MEKSGKIWKNLEKSGKIWKNLENRDSVNSYRSPPWS
jgi:hypothetical protein